MKINQTKIRNAAAGSTSLLLIFLCGESRAANTPWSESTTAAIVSAETDAAFNPNFFQERTITGAIVDEKGAVIPGVTIHLKSNPAKLFMADDNGRFSVTVGNTPDVLVFEAVGFQITEVAVSAQSTALKVTMNSEASVLDDVVVVGYGTQSRRKVTSAVSRLDGKRLESLPINSIGEGMKGKVAGLRVYTTDNQPGENPTFRIRGGSSINQSDAPIVVVDGVVREISGINPNDIESIEVLKDAASAAIYGARASNGIILITTKKGSSRKPSILFESNIAHQSPSSAFDLMNAEDYLFYMRKAVAEGKYPQRNFQNGFSMSSANTESSMWTSRYLESGETVPAGWKSMPDPLDPTKTIVFQDVDYQKRFFDNSRWENYYLGVNGGNEQIKYAASAGYTKDGGIGINTGYDRFTMRGNLDFKITEKLSFATGYDFARTNLEDYPDNKRNVVQRGLSTPFTHRLYNSITGLPEKGYNGSTPAPDW